MKGFFERHSNSFLTAILSFIVTGVAVCVSIFCFFNGHSDIPLGFALGGVVIGGLYMLSALAERLDDKKGTMIFSIGVISLRMFILVGVSILLAFMNYRWNTPIFNLFSFIGIYTAAIVCNVIVHLVNKK